MDGSRISKTRWGGIEMTGSLDAGEGDGRERGKSFFLFDIVIFIIFTGFLILPSLFLFYSPAYPFSFPFFLHLLP